MYRRLKAHFTLAVVTSTLRRPNASISPSHCIFLRYAISVISQSVKARIIKCSFGGRAAERAWKRPKGSAAVRGLRPSHRPPVSESEFSFEWLICTVVNLFEVGALKLHALVEARLDKLVRVGQMNFPSLQPTFSEMFLLIEDEYATSEVVAYCHTCQPSTDHSSLSFVHAESVASDECASLFERWIMCLPFCRTAEERLVKLSEGTRMEMLEDGRTSRPIS